MLDALDLAPDASVGLSIEAGRLVVDPNRRRRYSLDELLAQCKPPARSSRRDREWATGKAAGRELI
jgi:antitoxin ChpS